MQKQQQKKQQEKQQQEKKQPPVGPTGGGNGSRGGPGPQVRQPVQPPKPAIAARAPAVPVGARPVPTAGGGTKYTTRTGQTYTTNARGQVTGFQDANHTAKYDSTGQARFIQTSHNGTTTSVTRGYGGTKTVQTQYADGTRVVSYGPNNGYAERPIAGRPGYVSRTYTVNNVTTVTVYRSYSYRGYAYYGYVPAYYYAPAYYGWIGTPWGYPVAYGWGPQPWGLYYGAYFTPYPNYLAADLWLTDYLFYASLQSAYAARQANPDYGPPPAYYQNGPGPDGSYVAGDGTTAAAAPPPPLDPSVKTLVDNQVKADLNDMQHAPPGGPSPNAVPEVLQPDHTTFQVSSDTQLEYGQDQSCNVGPGDILFRNPQSTVDGQGYVEVMVLGSKPGSCPVSTQAKISLATLGDINNQFEAQLQSGMQLLAAKAGSGSIPPSPPMGATAVAAGTAPPQPGTENLVAMNQTNATQAETEIQSITATQATPTT